MRKPSLEAPLIGGIPHWRHPHWRRPSLELCRGVQEGRQQEGENGPNGLSRSLLRPNGFSRSQLSRSLLGPNGLSRSLLSHTHTHTHTLRLDWSADLVKPGRQGRQGLPLSVQGRKMLHDDRGSNPMERRQLIPPRPLTQRNAQGRPIKGHLPKGHHGCAYRVPGVITCFMLVDSLPCS